jgi:5'-methylthioadenosine phosphorylase
MVTDYDCWHTEHDDVDIQMVLETLKLNADHAGALIRAVLPAVAAAPRDEAIANSTQFAVITAPELRPPETVAKLKGIIDGL